LNELLYLQVSLVHPTSGHVLLPDPYFEETFRRSAAIHKVLPLPNKSFSITQILHRPTSSVALLLPKIHPDNQGNFHRPRTSKLPITFCFSQPTIGFTTHVVSIARSYIVYDLLTIISKIFLVFRHERFTLHPVATTKMLPRDFLSTTLCKV
jgi:hypothetical protein